MIMRKMRRTPLSTLAILFLAAGAIAQPNDKPAPKPAETAETPEEAAPAIPTLSESLTGMAKAEYEAGRILFTDGDYAGAKLKFERAHELSGDARLMWNVAAADKNLRNYSKVIRALTRYLADGGDKLTETDRSDAQSLIDTMGSFVCKLDVTSEPAGARVLVDGEEVGVTPFEAPLLVDQGTRTIRIVKEGFVPFNEARKLPGGGGVVIQTKLKPETHEGRLRVIAGPGDIISVDGRVVGKGSWEGKLKSGVHSVSVTASGKRPYQTDVIVQDDQLSTSRVALESEAKPKDEGGFFAGPWPWVIGGAVVATGVGVGTFFALRSDEQTGPGTVAGTLPPRTIQLPLGF